MADKKAYREMTLDELNEACDGWHQRLLEARHAIRTGRATMDEGELLDLHRVVGEAQAHMNVIQPLRTAHFIREEFERSQESERMKGRLSEEAYRAMLQEIGVPFIESTTVVHGTE